MTSGAEVPKIKSSFEEARALIENEESSAIQRTTLSSYIVTQLNNEHVRELLSKEEIAAGVSAIKAENYTDSLNLMMLIDNVLDIPDAQEDK